MLGNVKKYYNNLIKLFAAVNRADSSVSEKIWLLFSILVCSNLITSVVFGMPVLLFLALSRGRAGAVNWMFKTSLIYFPIRVITHSHFKGIRALHSSLHKSCASHHDLAISESDRTSLKVNGFVKLRSKIPAELINSITEDLWLSRGYSAQVAAQGRPGMVRELSKSARFVSHDIASESVQACAVALFKNCPVKKVLNELTGVDLSLYSVNFYWGFPQSGPLDSVQKFHRDYDGYNCWVVFFALSDVTPENGATVIKAQDGSNTYLSAKAGDIFIVDPFFIHRANPKVITNRLTCWIRFGELPNLAYNQDLNFSGPQRTVLDNLNRLASSLT